MLAILYDMEINISVFISGYEKVSSFSRNGFNFDIVLINGKKVLFGAIGYTKNVNSSLLEYLINDLGVTKIILTGNTAGYSVTLLDIAISTEAFAYDVDFTPIGFSDFELPDVPQYLYGADTTLVSLAATTVANLGYDFSLGVFASADSFMANNTEIANLHTNYGVTYVDTETATVGELCYFYNIPFVAVKAVSNHGGTLAPTEYSANKMQANINSVKIGIDMAETLTIVCEPICLDFANMTMWDNLNVLGMLNTGVLSTASNSAPYAVPMNYILKKYNDKHKLILFSDFSGMKMANLKSNPYVCFTVMNTEGKTYKSVLVIGTAKIIRGSSDCCYDTTIEIFPTCIVGREYFMVEQ